ncbi:hypothetical protein [Microvirga makkahensis]|uniref:Uncharacterized protein n=1 Tax=Microvirga makkahensis TaxID=1128670 RepID=A0A7X3SNJ5_9HYPH|nr:hypothetical protein [Microvirga makkahensis]MXQ11104.1 hypothetical protein [Microvirga makkahensis]
MMRQAALASSLLILVGPALAEQCRIPDPRPGQPLQVPSTCKDVVRLKQQKAEALKSEPGAIDLGNGTTVRIGGRVRVETGWSR